MGCVGWSIRIAYTPIPWVMIVLAQGVRRKSPWSGQPYVMYAYIMWEMYPCWGGTGGM